MRKTSSRCTRTWITVILAVILCMVTAWVYIHRRLIRALIGGKPAPACPHPLPGCIKEKLASTDPPEAE